MPWCQHCRDLLATTFAEPRDRRPGADGFVPVHVDAERRPDVNQRYGTGAWPTIAWLTPDGELIAHEQLPDADAAGAAACAGARRLAGRGDDIKKGLARAVEPQRPRRRRRAAASCAAQMVDDIADAIYEKFDHRYGGFGDGSKFPHPEALDFALVQVMQARRRAHARSGHADPRSHDGEPAARHRRRRLLPLLATPDWHTPNYEKLLDQNALVLRAYLEAYQVFGKRGLPRAPPRASSRWMLDYDARPAHRRVRRQPGRRTSTTSSATRRERAPPRAAVARSHRSTATPTRMAVSSLLKASAVLEQPDLARAGDAHAALPAREPLRRRGDVYHYWDGTYHLPGMLGRPGLSDARADRRLAAHRRRRPAAAGRGDRRTRDPAAARPPNGGFYDILHDPGNAGLDAAPQPRRSSTTRRWPSPWCGCRTCRAAPSSTTEATAALESFAGDYKEYGYYVAGYGRAVDLIFYEPLFVTIVGDRDAPSRGGAAPHRAVDLRAVAHRADARPASTTRSCSAAAATRCEDHAGRPTCASARPRGRGPRRRTATADDADRR